MPTITYQKELFKDIMPELPELFYENWRESEFDKDAVPLEIDWMRLLNTENLGILHILTARDGKKLAGYVFLYVQKTTHHAGTLLAASDAVYLKKEYRRGLTGAIFIKKTIQMVRDLGVKKLYISYKIGSKLGKLLLLLGFSPSDETCSILL